ncbi:hypothetical protein HP572_05540 [Pectobacterium sp. PL64]|uniref:hypothetical protein n=1 Tax=Pectobacterium sp. PL64 TaxID=2738983 RepID=UPI001F0B9B9F|nr:hypothetical protein [Pectobacterium sp. PL64]UMO89013.1 hypothetical protein HP572_05540 [Pectobacterium sp. PL64]
MVDKLSILVRSEYRMSMREVSSYINKIDRFFRRDEFKLDAEEDKIYWKQHENKDLNFDSDEFILKIQRKSHNDRYNLFLKFSAVMIYSAFETSLCAAAEIPSYISNDKVKLNKNKSISRNNKINIERYKEYLVENHDVKFDGLEEIWGRINGFRFVRNIIVHKGGELESNDFERFDKVSDQEIGLSRNHEFIFIELVYLTQIVDIMDVFFDNLYKT